VYYGPLLSRTLCTMSTTINPLGRLVSQIDTQLLISTDSYVQVF